jgi:uncharacterized membrane protein YgdD (TMEM256/DUF423 family)
MKDTWKVGSTYHLLHTCALGLSAFHFHGKKQKICCTLFLTGIILFSGSCYTVVIMNERKPYSSFAPIGGFSLIAGWLALGLL